MTSPRPISDLSDGAIARRLGRGALALGLALAVTAAGMAILNTATGTRETARPTVYRLASADGSAVAQAAAPQDLRAAAKAAVKLLAR